MCVRLLTLCLVAAAAITAEGLQIVNVDEEDEQVSEQELQDQQQVHTEVEEEEEHEVLSSEAKGRTDQLEQNAASIQYMVDSDTTLEEAKLAADKEAEEHKKFEEMRIVEENRRHAEEQTRIQAAIEAKMRLEEATAVASALEHRLADEKTNVARAKWSEEQAEQHRAEFGRQAAENRAKASAAKIWKAEAMTIAESEAQMATADLNTVEEKKSKLADMAAQYFVDQQQAATNTKIALSAQSLKDQLDKSEEELTTKRNAAAERARKAKQENIDMTALEKKKQARC